MSWKDWTLLAGLMGAGASASAFLSVDNRMVNVVVSAGVIGVAWLVAQTRRRIAPLVRLIVAGACVAGALAALIAHNAYEGVCTATNASGDRVVIGTTLTDDGRRVKEQNRYGNNELLESLGDRNVEFAWTSESIAACRLTLTISGALWIPLFGVAAVAATTASRFGRIDNLGVPRSSTPRAFISYTHDDAATAQRLKALLQQHKIDVIIDSDSMAPGERITDFINRSIRECDAVVSVISSHSLNSPWVASEAMAGMARNTWGREVALIACCLDDDWLRPEFRLECTKQIDERLRRIEELLVEYAARKIDPADLNEERSRLYALRNSLGEILARLKNSLYLDVRDAHFDASGARLVKALLASVA